MHRGENRESKLAQRHIVVKGRERERERERENWL